MNRLGFIMLSILEQNSAIDRLTSMSVREMAQAEELGKENTVYKKMREFEKAGYVSRGLKEGHAGTFYITAAGRECLEDERK